MGIVKLGTVKAWELNSISKTLGVCIPKTARENLGIHNGTKFRVKIDIDNCQLILEPQPFDRKSQTEKKVS